jgi:hypothetical protein
MNIQAERQHLLEQIRQRADPAYEPTVWLCRSERTKHGHRG